MAARWRVLAYVFFVNFWLVLYGALYPLRMSEISTEGYIGLLWRVYCALFFSAVILAGAVFLSKKVYGIRIFKNNLIKLIGLSSVFLVESYFWATRALSGFGNSDGIHFIVFFTNAVTATACIITVYAIVMTCIAERNYRKLYPKENRPSERECCKTIYDYIEQSKAYRENPRPANEYEYAVHRYKRGKESAGKPYVLAWTYAHRWALSVFAVFLCAVTVFFSVCGSILDNRFTVFFAEKVGYHTDRIEYYLGEPYKQTESQWIYVDDGYRKIARIIEQNEKRLLSVKDEKEMQKLVSENLQLSKQLSQMTYAYIEVLTGKDGVESVKLDTRRCDSATSEVKWSERAQGKIELSVISYTWDWDDATTHVIYSVIVSARIYYLDGSYQMYVLPESATSGIQQAYVKHTVKWSDSWGSYSASVEWNGR